MNQDDIEGIHLQVCQYLGISPCKIVKGYYPFRRWTACYNGVICLNISNLPNHRNTWIISIAHETFHLLQASKGYSYFNKKGVAMWKGKTEEYYLKYLEYRELPWEREALNFELEWMEFYIDGIKGFNYNSTSPQLIE